MDNVKQQLVERIKTATNVLVTVGRNPSVDALSALLGLTLVLNKQGKHAAAVFSGQVPSTIEFLQPEQTIEKNTDSLRDFIIALDKNKAAKLRYKVEDNVVRIFITPYKTSISESDFEFSEGDFNIDVVIAIGVRKQEDLDEAITAHGRILHDATVATININPDDGGLGSINWFEPQASSLSELVTELTQVLGANLLDEQIATALLTGIVAETDRFSNNKTGSITMSLSATLMKAGANQQLVASKLDGQIADFSDRSGAETAKPGNTGDKAAGGTSKDDGSINIDHSSADSSSQAGQKPESEKQPDRNDDQTTELSLDRQIEKPPADMPPPNDNKSSNLSSGPKLVTEPPALGGTLTANSRQIDIEPVTDPLSLPKNEEDKVLEHDKSNDIKAPDLKPISQTDNPSPPPPAPTPPPTSDFTPPPQTWSPPEPPTPPPSSSPPSDSLTKGTNSGTLTNAGHLADSSNAKGSTIDAARDEVNKAYNETVSGSSEVMPPIDGLNAQPLGGDLHPDQKNPSANQGDNNVPPPVPPPIPFQFGGPPS